MMKSFNFSWINILKKTRVRSTRPELFCKKGVFRNFAKFTGIHLCQRLFFNKVAGLRPATWLKKSHWPRCIPVNLVKLLRSFLTEHLRWLLLSSYKKREKDRNWELFQAFSMVWILYKILWSNLKKLKIKKYIKLKKRFLFWVNR